MRSSSFAVLALVASSSGVAAIAEAAEQPLLGLTGLSPAPQTSLYGRFLHLTDLHPDPFYRFNSSEDGACHGGLGRDEHRGDRAGYWGTSVRSV